MSSFIKGVKWSTIQQLLNMGINYSSLIVLTIFLTPEDFGLVALSTILIGLFQVINGFGIPQLIIKDSITDRHQIGYYLTLSVLFSVGLTLVCLLLARLYVLWYDNSNHDELLKIISVSTLGLIVSSISSVYNALYQKDLDFKRPAIFTTLTLALGQLIALFYAVKNGGYWALVIRNLAPTALLAISFILFSSYKPIPNIKKKFIKEDRKFTFWLSTNQIINYTSRNLDYLIIGRFFDVGVVGQYSIAYRIMLMPMKLLSSRVQAVLYPTLVKLKNQKQDVLSFYSNIVSYVSIIALPIMAFAGLTASLWVPLIFDEEKFELLIPLIQLLTVAGAFQALTSPIGSLYLVYNYTRLMAIYSLISGVVFLIGFIIGGFSSSIIVFAQIYVLLSILMNFFASNFIPLKVLNYSFYNFLTKSLQPIVPVIVSYVSIYILMFLIPAEYTYRLRLLSVTGAGLLFFGIYILTYKIIFKHSFDQKVVRLKSILVR